MKQKRPVPMGMPALTLDGKRAIVAKALNQLGEKAFVSWLQSKDIPSLRYFQENIRKYKMKFFQELYFLIK